MFLQGWSIYLIIWRRNPGPFGHEYPALALLATRCHFIIIMILSGGEDSQTLACWRGWETPLSKTLDMMWCDEFWQICSKSANVFCNNFNFWKLCCFRQLKYEQDLEFYATARQLQWQQLEHQRKQTIKLSSRLTRLDLIKNAWIYHLWKLIYLE